MEASLADGRANVVDLCRGDGAVEWCAQATRAAERVVRKSLEMRAIAVVM